jgi:hypothetical protein
MKCLSSILLFLVFVWDVSAQDVISVDGMASMRVDDNLSWNEAKEQVRQAAKINALEKAFGVYVEQYTRMDMEEGATHFRVIGETRVKGEWLKTTQEVFTEEERPVSRKDRKNRFLSSFLGLGTRDKHERSEIWITCELKGKTRLVDKPVIGYEFTVQRCIESYCETTDFNLNDPLFLRFRTPVDGYLSIYMVQEDNRAYRLLPYQSMPERYRHSAPVKADVDYVFFSNNEEHDYFEEFSYLLVDELYLDTDNDEEILELFVLFSTDEFNKLNLKDAEENDDQILLPRSSKKELFQEWLADNRIYDPDFSYKRTLLRIKR